MRARNVTVAQLARAAGMSYQGVKKIVDGKTKEMEPSTCTKVAKYLGVHAEWLQTGQGPRELSSGPPKERVVSESQWALLEDFEMLPDDDKQALRTTMKAKADNVRRIVKEYLGRQGMTGTASDARIEATYGAPPAPPPDQKVGAGSYVKSTPVPRPSAQKGSSQKEE